MSGADDPIIPLANARLMRRLIPDARLHIFPGGHLSLVTEASQLAPVVSEFLTEERPASGRLAPERTA
jgi:pimeloyl-ACP methyl ester carboxylesterase